MHNKSWKRVTNGGPTHTRGTRRLIQIDRWQSLRSSNVLHNISLNSIHPFICCSDSLCYLYRFSWVGIRTGKRYSVECMLEAMVAGQLKTVSIDIHWYLLSIRTGEASLKWLRLTTAAGVTFTKVLMPTQFEMVSDKRIHSKFGQ